MLQPFKHPQGPSWHILGPINGNANPHIQQPDQTHYHLRRPHMVPSHKQIQHQIPPSPPEQITTNHHRIYRHGRQPPPSLLSQNPPHQDPPTNALLPILGRRASYPPPIPPLCHSSIRPPSKQSPPHTPVEVPGRCAASPGRWSDTPSLLQPNNEGNPPHHSEQFPQPPNPHYTSKPPPPWDQWRGNRTPSPPSNNTIPAKVELLFATP